MKTIQGPFTYWFTIENTLITKGKAWYLYAIDGKCNLLMKWWQKKNFKYIVRLNHFWTFYAKIPEMEYRVE